MKKAAIVLLILLLNIFLGCEKKDASKIKPPDGTPVITVQPKGATYLKGDEMKELTIKASAPKGYELTYKWYVMQGSNVIYESLPDYVISIKLPDNNKETFFREMTTQSFMFYKPEFSETRTYICVVTSLSPDGEKTFQTISDPAVVTINDHPLSNWFSADREPFEYYFSGTKYMQLNDIAFGNDRFVVVGSNFGYDIPTGQYGRIAYSDDGKKWDIVKDTVFDDWRNTIYAVAYGNGRFVAVGSNGKTAYSTDAKTWTTVENVLTGKIYEITFGNGCFIARSYYGLAYSNDGVTWSAVENFSSAKISYINFVNNHFFAADGDGNIYFSNDGKTWRIKKTDVFDSYSTITVAYGNRRYVAYARKYIDYDLAKKIVYSDDGETWIEYYLYEHDKDWGWISKIIYSEGYFVAVGADKVIFSKDGIKWIDLNSDSQRGFSHEINFYYKAVAYGNGHFVAVSDEGVIKYCQFPAVKETSDDDTAAVIVDYK